VGGSATTGFAGAGGGIVLNSNAGGPATGAGGTAGGGGQINGVAGAAGAISNATGVVNSGGFIDFTAGVGSEVSSVAGPAVAGAGGSIDLFSGTGGAQIAAAAVGNGGPGGLFQIKAGTGGSIGNATGTGTAGVGGDLYLEAGGGGTKVTSGTPGAGGVTYVIGGNRGGATAAYGGVSINAGGNTYVAPAAGAILVKTSNGKITVNSTTNLTYTGAAGDVEISSIASDGGQTAGNVLIGSTGNISGSVSGKVIIYGGNAVTAPANAGDILINANAAAADLRFNARSGTEITLNESGQTALSGFTATSIVGALNELKVTAVAASQIVQTGFDTTTNLVTSGQLGYLTTTANRVQKGIATSLAASLVFGANEGTAGKMTTEGTIEAMKAEPGITIAAGDRLFLSAVSAGTATNVAPSTVTQVVVPVGYARTAGTGGTLAGAMAVTDTFSAGPTQTLSVAGAFVAGDVGRTIKITGATSAGNNGYFVITSVVAGTSATYTNAGAVAENALITTTYDISAATDMLLKIGSPVVL
jgi:hypothetical protein